MERIFGIIQEIFVELLAGLAGAVIVWALAKMGPKRLQQWVDKLRLVGWKLLALIFLAIALTIAIKWTPPRPIAVTLGTVLVLVSASFIPPRFMPAKISHLRATIRAYVWQILSGFFFMSTVTLLIIIWVFPPYVPRIHFVVDLADQELIALKDILDGAERKLGAEVFLVNVDRSRYVARLDHMVASNSTQWDLIALDNSKTGLLAAKGLVEDLSQYAEYDELIPESLLPSIGPILKFEDRWYFAPFRPNVKIAFYNEPKFALYGLRPPMTRDELLHVAKVFKEKEHVGRVAIQGYPGPASVVTVFEFVKAAGGNPRTLDDDESWETFEFLKDLEPYLASEYKETRFDTANELLIDETVYLVYNWTYGIKVVIIDAGKKGIKTYRGWRGPQDEVHVLGGDVLAIPKGAPHAEEAVKLIEFLISKETQSKLVDSLCWPPVRLDAYDVSPEMEPYFKSVREAIAYAEVRPTVPQWTMVESVLDGAFGELVREGKDISILEKYRDMLKKIPSEYIRYTVWPGDTLELVAQSYNTTEDILAQANGITTGTSLAPGQILLVPGQ